MIFIPRKKIDIVIKNYDGFHTQEKSDCDGCLKTLFFEMEKPIDETFIEYMKPFGYPVLLPGNIYEIQRDNFFRLMLPLGRTSFHAEFEKDCDKDSKNHLIQQTYRGINGIVRENIEGKCPENAIDFSGGRFTVNLRKCTYCLDCVI